MRNEQHRAVAVEAFTRYLEGLLPVTTFRLRDLGSNDFILTPDAPYIYILRLEASDVHPSVHAIPNSLDPKRILYIGGHPSGKATRRYNALLTACRKAEAFYRAHGYAQNDTEHGHTTAALITTGLLQCGFSIADCQIDLVTPAESYDELELLIGYQERFHHLPPWNTQRGGSSRFQEAELNEALAP